MRSNRPTKKKTKKTAFVPRNLFLGALATASVIPLVACGGSVAGASDAGHAVGVAGGGFGVADGAFVRRPDAPIYTVAQVFADASNPPPFDGGIGPSVAACCFDASFGVADGAFGVAFDAFAPPPDATFGVADASFGVGAPAFDGSVDAHDSGPILGVAACCFDSGK